MSLWNNTDANTSAPKFAAAGGYGVSANGFSMFDTNTAIGLGGTGNVSVMGVDTTEQGVAGNPKGGHAGWVLVKRGTGGRAGRIQVETLVAMGSMTGDGSASANDDTTFADA